MYKRQAVQEGLDYFGVKTDHIAIRTSYTGARSYSQMVDKADAIRVHGLQYLLENLCSHHSLLIIDDVYSTGSSVSAVISQLAKKTRRNLPHDIRIGTVWYRPTEKTLRIAQSGNAGDLMRCTISAIPGRCLSSSSGVSASSS